MKRLALFFGLAALVVYRKRIRCALVGHSVGRRQFIGGHRCTYCNAALDAERVDPNRRQGPRWDKSFYRRVS